MRTFDSVHVACVVLALPARGQDKKPAADAKKIVGTWEVVKSGSTPKGSTVEFTKDGATRQRIAYSRIAFDRHLTTALPVCGNRQRPPG